MTNLLSDLDSNSEFQFPAIYKFPPFFTRQPNEQTWKSQLSSWRSLILGYCRHYKIWTLELSRTSDSSNGDMHKGQIDGELFFNKTIDRGLKQDLIQAIFEDMVRNGDADWYDGNQSSKDFAKSSILVYWKRPQEWATAITEWVESTGQTGSILTLYEISNGDLALSQEFHNIHPLILRKAVDVIVQRGKGLLMKDSTGQEAGVKFL